MPLVRSADIHGSSPPRPGSRPILFREQRRQSEESIATELCDGPIFDDADQINSTSSRPGSPSQEIYQLQGNREALIERIKQRNKISWRNEGQANSPAQEHQEGFFPSDDLASPGESGEESESFRHKIDVNAGVAATVTATDNLSIGLEIRRPSSALHAGDFNGNSATGQTRVESQSASNAISTSPPRPLPCTPSPTAWRPPRSALRLAFSGDLLDKSSALHSQQQGSEHQRSPSHQPASPKYILKPPTSPLVREASDSEYDFDDVDADERRRKSSRRHTFSPAGSLSQSNDYSQLTAAARTPASLRREGTFPLHSHSHRSRRSLGASWAWQPGTSPVTPPSLRSRAPSFSDAASERQSSMVGSYEESILRGRMSGTPSLPLTFEAGIGALGKPGCKPTMPQHVKIDFPAVFYSWTDGHGRVGSVDQEPSPYVGRIDLENNLEPPSPRRERKRRRDGGRREETSENPSSHVINTENPRKRKGREVKSSNEQSSLKQSFDEMNLGGVYRIPKRGSLQLVVKNPNKTAVKVFIVPYDLEGMQPFQRTWIRQRLYSAGPIVEKPMTSKPQTEADRSTSSGRAGTDGKPTLRYLIHFKICCTGKERFFLYDEIRLVFANRVPDNKEKLRSEIMMPEEPRFMPFRQGPQTWPSSSSIDDSMYLLAERMGLDAAPPEY